MTLREKFIRALARAIGVKNLYEGARYSPSRSLLQAGVQSARLDINETTRLELVRKSRYFYANNALQIRLADVFKCYTAGSGLPVTPQSSDPEWNKRAKDDWGEFESKCDIESRATFSEVQGLWANMWWIDGESFTLLTHDEKNYPRIQVIEAHRCSTPPEFRQQDGVTMVDGVALSASSGYRAVEGYFIHDEERGGQLRYSLKPVPASGVVHLFERTRAGQRRGIPMISGIINEMHDLDDLHVLEMKSAKDNASITRLVHQKTGPVDLEGIARGNAVTDAARQLYYRQTSGGDIIPLLPGDEYNQFGGERPTVVTMEYWRSLVDRICMGAGIPTIVVMPSSIQGTVYRGVLDIADQWFKAQATVIINASRQVYRHYMRWAIDNRPKLKNPPEDWWKCSICAPRSVNVDVGKEARANIELFGIGANDYESYYSPQGKHWRDRFDALKEQIDYAKSIGLDLTELNPRVQPDPTNDPQNSSV